MKKFFCILLALASSLAAQKIDDNSGIILGDGVNVRNTPSIDGSVVTKLKKATLVSILARDSKFYALVNSALVECKPPYDDTKCNSWYKIKSGNNIGWVFGGFLGASINYKGAKNISGAQVCSYTKGQFSPDLLRYINQTLTIQDQDMVFFLFFKTPTDPYMNYDCFVHGVALISEKNGWILPMDFNTGSEILAIYSNKQYFVLDNHFQCYTSPCHWNQLSFFPWKNFENQKDLIYDSYGSEQGDTEVVAEIIFQKSTIFMKKYSLETRSGNGSDYVLTITTGNPNLNSKEEEYRDKKVTVIKDPTKAKDMFDELRDNFNKVRFETTGWDSH